jgi:hypothetical protein
VRGQAELARLAARLDAADLGDDGPDGVAPRRDAE